MTRKRFWFAAFIGLFILVYTIKQADLKRLAQNFQDIDLWWAFWVIAASALSYLCVAAVLHCLLRGMGHALPFTSAFQISLLSCTLNYVMAIGGLSGVAAKVYLLARERIPPSKTLSISMVHGFLTNTIAVTFLYLGFFFLYNEYQMNARQMGIAIAILLLAFLLTWITIQTIAHESFRKGLWQIVFKMSVTVCRKLHHPRWFHIDRADAFFENFNNSMNLLVKNARILLIPSGFALLDWLLMFSCLKCAFLAVHYPVDNSTLLVGFSVGIFTTLFALTPVSIGIMEGSMAGAFYFMGLDYDRALLATLIYRIAYYFLPILVSLFLYRNLFIPAERVELEREKES